MITIISGTNRENNNSIKVSRYYQSLLTKHGLNSQILDLRLLPSDFMRSDMYGKRSAKVQELIDQFVINIEYFVFVLPEYNGGFPGIVKLFMDGMTPAHFYNKKAILVGLSSGRTGNIRGMDAFGNVLNYLQMEVLSKKVKLSSIESILKEEEIINEECNVQLNLQISKFIKHYLITS